MTYGVQWQPHNQIASIAEAEKRALRPGQVWGLGFLYRFEDHIYARRIDPWDDSDDNWTSIQKLELNAYLIRSVTPKGWTIEWHNALGWRFISRETTKQFALPTVEQAKESFIARKRKQQAIYEARAKKAARAIELLYSLYPSLSDIVGS